MNQYNITQIEGGVLAAKGFKAAGVHAGFRKNKQKRDLALIVADDICNAAGVYTTNKVYAAPVGVTREHLKNGKARAIICNSGNANTCNLDGYDKANATCRELAKQLQIDENDVIVASTGVIGVPLPLEPIINGIPLLIDELAYGAEASNNAACAIMTTDVKKKEYSYEFILEDKIVHIGGICKGSGMICPNMATMLCFITTDIAIKSELLQKALSEVIVDTFNMVSVDGDTSTNDMVTILASGKAGNSEISSEDEGYLKFKAALFKLCKKLCMSIAADGEGATKLIECVVQNYSTVEGARVLAKSVISSALVKTAMFGADANWGRILCALGYSGEDFDTDKIDVKFKSKVGEILVCKDGRGVEFSEELAKKILLCEHIIIDVDTNSGNFDAAAWGCDLSYEYVRINGDYRS